MPMDFAVLRTAEDLELREAKAMSVNDSLILDDQYAYSQTSESERSGKIERIAMARCSVCS
jgi:hypothetical protein